MKRLKVHRLWIAGLAILLLIPFQNCSSGFEKAENSGLLSQGNGGSQVPGDGVVTTSCGEIPDLGTQTQTFYLSPSGATCDGIERTRTCRNGEFSAWSGSSDYSSPSCAITGMENLSCGNTPHQGFESGTFYEQESVPAGQSCGTGVVQRRQCLNGEFGDWDGPLTARGCEVRPALFPNLASVRFERQQAINISMDAATEINQDIPVTLEVTAIRGKNEYKLHGYTQNNLQLGRTYSTTLSVGQGRLTLQIPIAMNFYISDAYEIEISVSQSVLPAEQFGLNQIQMIIEPKPDDIVMMRMPGGSFFYGPNGESLGGGSLAQSYDGRVFASGFDRTTPETNFSQWMELSGPGSVTGADRSISPINLFVNDGVARVSAPRGIEQFFSPPTNVELKTITSNWHTGFGLSKDGSEIYFISKRIENGIRMADIAAFPYQGPRLVDLVTSWNGYNDPYGVTPDGQLYRITVGWEGNISAYDQGGEVPPLSNLEIREVTLVDLGARVVDVFPMSFRAILVATADNRIHLVERGVSEASWELTNRGANIAAIRPTDRVEGVMVKFDDSSVEYFNQINISELSQGNISPGYREIDHFATPDSRNTHIEDFASGGLVYDPRTGEIR